MRLFKGFRLLHRRTKSEGDMSNLITPTKLPCNRSVSQSVFIKSAAATPDAPVYMPLELSLPSLDPNAELYNLYTPNAPSTHLRSAPIHSPTFDVATILSTRINELETVLLQVQHEKELLESDLGEVQVDLANMRKELYDEMHIAARHGQRAVQLFSEVQEMQAKYRHLIELLVDIGVPHTVVDKLVCIPVPTNEDRNKGEQTARQVLANGVWDIANDGRSSISKSKLAIVCDTTPHEHRYQSALNLTLSVRREVKVQKKMTKFWKRLAQTDNKNKHVVTPSPSDVSSVSEELSPERKMAVEALIKKRRAADNHRGKEGKDVFESVSRASNPAPPLTPMTPSISLACSNRSSSPPGNMAFQTTSLPVTLFNLPSPPGPHSLSLSPSTSSALSTAFSIRRTFGHSARPSSGVLSNVDVNILRSFSIQSSEPGLIRQAEREEGEQGQQLPEEYRRTSSRRLAQNHLSVGTGRSRRQMPSVASSRSVSHSGVSIRLSQLSHPLLRVLPPNPEPEAILPATASFSPSPPFPGPPKPSQLISSNSPRGHTADDVQSSGLDLMQCSGHVDEPVRLTEGGSTKGTPLDKLCGGSNDRCTPVYESKPTGMGNSVSSSNVSDRLSEPSSADNYCLGSFNQVDSSSMGTLWSGPEESTDSLFGVSISEASTSVTPPQLTSGSSVTGSTPSPSSASASSPGLKSVKRLRSKLPIPKRLRRLSASIQNGNLTVGNLRSPKSPLLWDGSHSNVNSGTSVRSSVRQGKVAEKEKGGMYDKDTERHDSFVEGTPVRALSTPVLRRRMTLRPRVVSGGHK